MTTTEAAIQHRLDPPSFGSARLVLLYDGWCGVCTRAAEWAKRRDGHGRILIAPNQTPGLLARAGLAKAQVDRAAWALLRDGRALEGAAAINRALLELDRWRWLGRLYELPGFAWAEDLFYRWFAAHRSQFARWGATPACGRPSVACTPEGAA